VWSARTGFVQRSKEEIKIKNTNKVIKLICSFAMFLWGLTPSSPASRAKK
jgi:hypothetical protein